MPATTPCTRLDLQRDRIVRLTGVRGLRIDSLAGYAWVTVDGEQRDVVLSPGRSFAVTSRAPITVHAIHGPATVAVRAQAGTPVRTPRQGWRARVGAWATAVAPAAAGA